MKVSIKEVTIFEFEMPDDAFWTIDAYDDKNKAKEELLQIAKNIGNKETISAISYVHSPI